MGEQRFSRRTDGATNPNLGGIYTLNVAPRGGDQRRSSRHHLRTSQEASIIESFLEAPGFVRTLLRGILRRDQQGHDAAVGVAILGRQIRLGRQGINIRRTSDRVRSADAKTGLSLSQISRRWMASRTLSGTGSRVSFFDLLPEKWTVQS